MIDIHFIEKIKLLIRANKYKVKKDKGGIAYINDTIQKGQTALDIGAHKAAYLYFMVKKVGNQGKVFAFEPQRILYNYLNKIKNIFRWDNVTVERLALSDTEGVVTLYIPAKKIRKGYSPGATILENKKHLDYGLNESIDTESLDSYCTRKNVKPSFLKIDVEGNELKIFKGGITTLKNFKPKILVEIEARHVGREKAQETFDFLEALGYDGHFIDDRNSIPIADFDFDRHQNIKDMENYCNNFIFE
jgi:FkbM family methyltransferase